jgi:signal transduction histidine kinase
MRDHRVLLLEADSSARETISRFLQSSSPRLKIVAASVASLSSSMAIDPFDAVILGPGLDDTVILNTLRRLRSLLDDVPVLVLSPSTSSDTAIAVFQLGAHDLIHFREGCLTDLVFSLNSALKRKAIESLNRQLGAELAALNQSLAAQVAERTRDLEAQILVRQAAEQRAEEHAARLQALSTRLLTIQEDERHAIARELHDQVGQLLTGLRFRLEASRTEPAALDEALMINDELLRTVRALTLQLRPRMLDDLGLAPALEWHVAEFKKQTGITVELDLAMPPQRVRAALATTVFRMVQEALTNVARHSEATSAMVTVAADEHSLHVEISDRGRGFDPAAALAKHHSVGLSGLMERVKLVGGTLELFSKVGEGTRIHAEFPISETIEAKPLPPAQGVAVLSPVPATDT